MDFGMGEDDVGVCVFYESFGFNNCEGKLDGLVNYFYECEF